MHKAKDIGPMSDPNEELSTQNLAKAEYFNDFFVNISKNLTKQLDPLDINLQTPSLIESLQPGTMLFFPGNL